MDQTGRQGQGEANDKGAEGNGSRHIAIADQIQFFMRGQFYVNKQADQVDHRDDQKIEYQSRKSDIQEIDGLCERKTTPFQVFYDKGCVFCLRRSLARIFSDSDFN